MRIIIYIIVLLTLTFSCARLCNASQVFRLAVPFQNAFLNPNDKIIASFSFGVESLLFCFATNTQIVGVITWPYKGTVQIGNLPIFLKTNSIFSGSFTDPNGVLAIVNNTNQLLQVGCLFGY